MTVQSLWSCHIKRRMAWGNHFFSGIVSDLVFGVGVLLEIFRPRASVHLQLDVNLAIWKRRFKQLLICVCDNALFSRSPRWQSFGFSYRGRYLLLFQRLSLCYPTVDPESFRRSANKTRDDNVLKRADVVIRCDDVSDDLYTALWRKSGNVGLEKTPTCIPQLLLGLHLTEQTVWILNFVSWA
jgi:hypothetical protein